MVKIALSLTVVVSLSLLPVKQVQLGLSPSLQSLTPCAPVRPQLRHLNVYIYLTLRKKLKLRMGGSPFLFEGRLPLHIKFKTALSLVGYFPYRIVSACPRTQLS